MINQDELKKILLKAATIDNLDMVKLLIDTASVKGVEKGIYHSTVLCWAAANNHLEIVKYMIDNSVNINDKNLLGYTPLMCATVEGHAKIVEYLKEKGAV
jgi:ankyrin repeat protein